jgi:hypothetical protein
MHRVSFRGTRQSSPVETYHLSISPWPSRVPMLRAYRLMMVLTMILELIVIEEWKVHDVWWKT